MRKQKYIVRGLIALLVILSSATSYAESEPGNRYFEKYHKPIEKKSKPKASKEFRNLYVAVRGGVSTLKDSSDTNMKFDAGFLYGAAFGAVIDKEHWTGGMEFEILSRINGIEDVSATFFQDSFMFNAFARIKTGTLVSPYMLVGAGGALMLIDYQSELLTDFVFIYQLGLGSEFKLSEKFRLDLGYRYHDASKARLSSSTYWTEIDTSGQSVFAGFNYTF